jgi:hypothetical protein
MDDEFNMLGAAQRQHNLRQNEATRQEIAALREDLWRKEWAEKAAPKCPYCVGAITGGAVKCRHCASDIKWCEVRGENHPIKIDEDSTAFAASQERKLRAAAELKAAEQNEQKRVAEWQQKRVAEHRKANRYNTLKVLLVMLVVVVIVALSFLLLWRVGLIQFY